MVRNRLLRDAKTFLSGEQHDTKAFVDLLSVFNERTETYQIANPFPDHTSVSPHDQIDSIISAVVRGYLSDGIKWVPIGPNNG